MAFDGILITEVFHSLQGETSLTGIPFAFIRLTGCNLRCSYCDSVYAFKGGKRLTIEEILKTIEPYQVKHVLITGGEPLLQRNTPDLVRALNEKNYFVSIETHGEISIEPVAGHARIIMDIKTPSSQMARRGYAKNLPFLKSSDEIKFVIASPEDYQWAKQILMTEIIGKIPVQEILFSPMNATSKSPGHPPGISPKTLAENILRDRLPVRFQMQLHKWIWGAETIGV